MTALAAVSGGGPARDAGVRRMLDAAAHRAPRAPVTWASADATLGYRAAAADPPFASHPDGSALVLDGRLDNPGELRRALSLEPDAGSAAIALAAYAAWQEQAAAHLLGDFAFVVWDAPRRRLVAARDALGQRPLFYATTGGLTIVASEPQQILAHPSVEAAMNEGMIAEFLSGRPASVEETIWTEVRRLRPAHALIAAGGPLARKRYWDFNPDAAPARDRNHDEAFRAIFRDAIACRTRDARSIGVFLSGGLDSSAIAGAAQRLARERQAAPVRAYSLTFPGLPVDETPYIDAVARQWDLPSVRLPAVAPARTDLEAEIDRYRDLPAFPNGAVLNPLRRRAAAEVDVVLTGYGGDDWFTGSPLHTADLLRNGHLFAAVAQIGHDMCLPGRGYSSAGLIRTAVAPLLSPRMRAWLRPVAGAPRPVFPWIRPEFASRVSLADRIAPPAPPRAGTLVQTEMHRVATSLAQVLGDELEDRAAAAAGLDQRHPFNDRRVAEFGFALPEAQRWSGGETKVLLRRALADALPPLVRQRNDKAEFTPTLVAAIEGLGGRAFLSTLRVADAGWVDLPAIQRAYDEMTALYSRGEASYIPLADAVWSVAAVELWFTRQTKEPQ